MGGDDKVRELAVAQLVANGLTNREIAERLFVSPHTVNTHMRQVVAKPEVNSRVDARGLRQSATASTPRGRSRQPYR
jgi:DNA-binding CsgD family transcriptional regulator